MKIALMNEFSQAMKNEIVLRELKAVVEPTRPVPIIATFLSFNGIISPHSFH